MVTKLCQNAEVQWHMFNGASIAFLKWLFLTYHVSFWRKTALPHFTQETGFVKNSLVIKHEVKRMKSVKRSFGNPAIVHLLFNSTHFENSLSFETTRICAIKRWCQVWEQLEKSPNSFCPKQRASLDRRVVPSCIDRSRLGGDRGWSQLKANFAKEAS